MKITDGLPTEEEHRRILSECAAAPSGLYRALSKLGLLGDEPDCGKDTPMADEEHEDRSPVEFIAHLLEVGQWFLSAIELDPYRPYFADGERLREEAERIINPRSRLPEGIEPVPEYAVSRHDFEALRPRERMDVARAFIRIVDLNEVGEEEVRLCQETHRGFDVTCQRCGSGAVGVDSDVGYSDYSGPWGGAWLRCARCGLGSSLFSH